MVNEFILEVRVWYAVQEHARWIETVAKEGGVETGAVVRKGLALFKLCGKNEKGSRQFV